MKKIIRIILGCSIFFFWLLLGASNPNIDPTRPPRSKSVSQAGQLQSFQLTAIFIHANYSIAVINDKAVKVGDQIDEFTVTTIRPFTVELTGPQNTREVLQLVPTVIQNR